jgi:enoyl-CoA hydratase/carnithine racemase
MASRLGGGLTLATSCDIVITDPAPNWSLPEVPIGLFPAWGLASVVRRTGTPAARQLCWGIDILTGIQAVEMGLADVAAPDPLAEAEAIGRRLAALPEPKSVR